jgi:hypothetical protein
MKDKPKMDLSQFDATFGQSAGFVLLRSARVFYTLYHPPEETEPDSYLANSGVNRFLSNGSISW